MTAEEQQRMRALEAENAKLREENSGLQERLLAAQQTLAKYAKMLFGQKTERCRLPEKPAELTGSLFVQEMDPEEQKRLDKDAEKAAAEQDRLVHVAAHDRKVRKPLDTSRLEVQEEHLYPELDNAEDYTEMAPEVTDITGLSDFTMYGFQGCTNLRTITLPPSVELDWYLFDGCTSLERIVFLSDFTKIPKYAFRNCSSLVNIDIPSTVTEIGEYAFNGCSALRDVVLPEGFNNLGSYAFDGYSSITSITIPVRNISVCAFRNCTSLTTVSLANTEYIGNGAFSGCTQLRTINIPSSVSQIGGEAFFMCDITSFVVPEGVTEIRTATFQKCYNLRTISIPSTMKTINGYVFWDCTSLERVDVHATICTLGSGNFNSVVPDIYVPSGRGTAYRGFSGWSAFADHIFEF